MSLALIVGGILALSLMFYMALSPRHGTASAKEMTLVSGEWSPYSGSGLPGQGAASRVVSTVLRQMGYAPEIEFMPWKRAEEIAAMSESNEGVRGTFPYAKVPSRERDFYFSNPIMEIEMAVFYHAGRSPELGNLDVVEELQGLRMLPVAGYRYPEEVEPLLPSEEQRAGGNVEAFHRLIYDPKVDAVIEARLVGRDLLRKHFPQNSNEIQTAPLTFSSPLHLMASKRNPHSLRFIRDFNRVLDGLKQEGRIAALEAEVLEQIQNRQQIQLEPYRPDGLLHGYLEVEAEQSILLPRGTQAIVESWGKYYLEPSKRAEELTNLLVLVRILNGPMKDRQLFVDGRTVVLPSSNH